MRLWSTVVTQDITRPRRQSGRYGVIGGSALPATSRLLVDARLQISEERIDLSVGPAARHGRHVVRDGRPLVEPLRDQRAQALRLDQGRVVLDCGAVSAGAVQRVTLRADASPFLAAELQR